MSLQNRKCCFLRFTDFGISDVNRINPVPFKVWSFVSKSIPPGLCLSEWLKALVWSQNFCFALVKNARPLLTRLRNCADVSEKPTHNYNSWNLLLPPGLSGSYFFKVPVKLYIRFGWCQWLMRVRAELSLMAEYFKNPILEFDVHIFSSVLNPQACYCVKKPWHNWQM